MKKLAILFMFIFVLPMYPQDYNTYRIGTTGYFHLEYLENISLKSLNGIVLCCEDSEIGYDCSYWDEEKGTIVHFYCCNKCWDVSREEELLNKIYNPQYDTLFIPDGTVSLTWINDSTWTSRENGWRYLILEDIKNSCPVCRSAVFEKNTDIIFWSTYDYSYKYGDSPIGLESIKFTKRTCKSCGNIYVARKQALKRIE